MTDSDDEPDAVELPEQRDLDGDPVGQARLKTDDEDGDD